MKLATPLQTADYFGKAQAWFSVTSMFADVKSVVIMAIAEYLANQDNLTLYPHQAEPQ